MSGKTEVAFNSIDQILVENRSPSELAKEYTFNSIDQIREVKTRENPTQPQRAFQFYRLDSRVLGLLYTVDRYVLLSILSIRFGKED